MTITHEEDDDAPGRWTTAGLIKRLNDQRRMLDRIQSRLSELDSAIERQAMGGPQLDTRLSTLEKNVEFTLLAHRKFADALVKLRHDVLVLRKDILQAPQQTSTRGGPSQLTIRPANMSDTVLAVLKLLNGEEPKTSTQISSIINRSREHTARLMKHLRDQGLVTSSNNRIPARFVLTDEGKYATASFR